MRVLTPILTGTAIAALLAGGALAQSVAPAPRPQTAPPPAPLTPVADPLPTTRALFNSYVTANQMPGIVGAFGIGDSKTVFVSAGKIATDANAAAAGPDSLWRVYSMTKPITAMAAMILVEDGKLKLDQPVSDILPAFKNMRVQLNENTIESRPATKPITIRNLLTHTAGLGYSIVTKGPLLQLYLQKGIAPGAINAADEMKTRPTRPATLQDFANTVASVPLIADPGTKWSYSIGLDVMGAVIEKASGMSFDKFVQTRLFDPLKMKSSYWTVPQSEIGRFATNYAFAPGSTTMIPFDPAATSVYTSAPSFPYGGAGLVMSANDYDRFLHMLQNYGELDGVRVMKVETAKLAMSNLLPPGVSFESVAGATGGSAGPRMGFAAGGSVILEDKADSMGTGTYGWGGAAGTIAWVNPVKKIRGNVMVNYFPADKWPLRADVIKSLQADIARYQAK
jgi:CubicO group peptidase (beta-lactamase class C family)